MPMIGLDGKIAHGVLGHQSETKGIVTGLLKYKLSIILCFCESS